MIISHEDYNYVTTPLDVYKRQDLDFDVECEQLILYGICKERQEK